MTSYGWPSNVRELKAVISRAALLYDEPELRPVHLPIELVHRSAGAAQSHNAAQNFRPIVRRGPVLMVHSDAGGDRTGPHSAGVELCGGNRTVAAQHL